MLVVVRGVPGDRDPISIRIVIWRLSAPFAGVAIVIGNV